MFDRNPPSPAEIERWFLADPGVPPRTFELALVLGGTVSAGAYTAGALDFLIEALDSWTQLRDANNAAVPRHNVVLRVITGTSGGGVCAAIAGRALAYRIRSDRARYAGRVTSHRKSVLRHLDQDADP